MREDVYRNERITIEYCEEDFVVKTEVLRVYMRVIQHEYDHIEGILTDKISSLKNDSKETEEYH
jgi:peptide deformylase